MYKTPIPVKHTLKAFTMLELIIVMLLTGIVISTGYMMLRIFSMQQTRYTNSAAYLQDYFLLKKRMDRDFFNAGTLEKRNEHILVCNMPNGSVQYEFRNDETITRRDDKDTAAEVFDIRHHIAGWHVLAVGATSLVERLDLEIFLRDNRFPLPLCKQYDAATLFNLQYH
jgi:prepilin-type N-terminal cleavage/methylation domain-containing protein